MSRDRKALTPLSHTRCPGAGVVQKKSRVVRGVAIPRRHRTRRLSTHDDWKWKVMVVRFWNRFRDSFEGVCLKRVNSFRIWPSSTTYFVSSRSFLERDWSKRYDALRSLCVYYSLQKLFHYKRAQSHLNSALWH